MATYTVNLGGIDRSAIAEEVVSSAARVLMAAGFALEEVASLFRQAGDQLESGEAVRETEVDDYEADDSMSSGSERYDLIDNFDKLPSVKSLHRLAKRSDAIGSLDDEPSLVRAVKLVAEAIPLRREALGWLNAQAQSAGFGVSPNREEWIEAATDEQLDNEDQVIFLDDYQFSGNFNWHLISQVARALAASGEVEHLGSFGELVLDENVFLEVRIQDEVREAIEACGNFQDFSQYVLSQSGQGELAQSEFLDNFVRTYSFGGGTYMLQNWLDGLAAKGLVERYKRSNRWRISVS